jgi:nicotinate-nucleotide adenylyltransferase
VSTATGVLGGTFDPPHNGHRALAEGALRAFDLARLIVLVAARPGHRTVVADAPSRLRLAEAAFADLPCVTVQLDEHAYTVDAVSGGRFGEAIFVVGGDQGADFESWKDPEGVLRWVKLGVGTRSGYAQPELAARFGDRLLFFEVDSPPISSSEIRVRVARGEPIDDLVPRPVAELIAELGLYQVPETRR